MCGINLYIQFTKQDNNASQFLRRMNHAIQHRGPDAQDIKHSNNVCMGHVRLSIIDIDAGQQPMWSNDQRWLISYNGEIYNYKQLRQQLKQQGLQFRTQSDTEVILNLFQTEGIQCLQKLRGMFAFSIYDKQTGTTFVVRDRQGIKPLFYSHNDSFFIASSECKGIFASGLVEPKLNRSSVASFFKYQFSISPNSLFEQINELAPGHYLKIDSTNQITTHQYWDLHFPNEGDYESLDESYWLTQFEIEFDTACKLHTVADVPIASYLSGGIDSSETTYYLKQHSKKNIKSFSIHLCNPNSDESYAYKPVAEHLNIQNIELHLHDERSQGYINDFANALYHLEQPQRLAVDIPHFLLSDLVQQHQTKVVFSGDGADEIFGGYDCYRQDLMRITGNQMQSLEERQNLYRNEYTQYFAPIHMEMLLQLHEHKQQEKVKKCFGTYPAWFDFWHILDNDVKTLFKPDLYKLYLSDHQMRHLASHLKPNISHWHVLNQSLYLEAKMRLPGWILHKSDRLSMAHGVEARVPFLDHKLVEFCARIPPQFKLNGMDEKYLLKQLAKKHLPTIPGDYKKRGFYTPIREWFDPKHNEFEEYLSLAALQQNGFFNEIEVKKLQNDLFTRPLPQTLDDIYIQMRNEWMFLLILSTQILFSQFELKKAPCFNDI